MPGGRKRAEKIEQCRECTFCRRVNKAGLGIKTRLLAGCGIVLLFLMAVGILSLVQLYNIDRSYSDLVPHKTTVISQTKGNMLTCEQAALQMLTLWQNSFANFQACARNCTAAMEEVSAAAESLSGVAADLKTLAEKFKL